MTNPTHAVRGAFDSAQNAANASPCLQFAPAGEPVPDFAQLVGPFDLFRNKRIAMARAALAADRLAQGQLSKQAKAATVHEWAVNLLAVLKGAR